MSIKFDKAILMSGMNYQITESLILYHPTIEEMLHINNGHFSEQIYWGYISILMSDPYSNMVFLDDIGLNFMEVSPFEVLMLQIDKTYSDAKDGEITQDILASINAAFNFFLIGNHDFVKVSDTNGNMFLIDKNNDSCIITRDIYEIIYEWVKAINKVDHSDRINPADENARRILIEDTRDEIKKRKRRKKTNVAETDYIGNLMSAVSFGGNGSITPFNVNQCKIYWIFEGFSVDHKKSNASHILDGIYHGTLSYKDINKKELDWTK